MLGAVPVTLRSTGELGAVLRGLHHHNAQLMSAVQVSRLTSAVQGQQVST